MMKHEFEALAKRKITDEQFEAIEKLYMGSTLNKQDFVKSIKGMLKTIPEPEKEKNIKKMMFGRLSPPCCLYAMSSNTMVLGLSGASSD